MKILVFFSKKSHGMMAVEGSQNHYLRFHVAQIDIRNFFLELFLAGVVVVGFPLSYNIRAYVIMTIETVKFFSNLQIFNSMDIRS